MPYEYNPLIKDCFQKTSEVSPSDIDSLEGQITDLKQKKVTKFFSANDYLEDNEIAQYQGDDDSANNLQNGFFYKKNPAFTITQNSDTFNYNVGRKVDWFLRNNSLKVTQYYLGDIPSSMADFHYAYDSIRGVEILFFAETYAKSPALKASATAGILYFPFAISNNYIDFDNYVNIVDNKYYYKGEPLNFDQSSGGVQGILCASIGAPYRRYLWLPVITRGGRWIWAAFLYETNSNNELILLGVDNNLSAFDFCYYQLDYIVPAITINVQGYILTENQRFSLCLQPPRYTLSYAGIGYGDGVHYLQFFKNGLGLMIRGNPDKTKNVQIANVSTKYSGLIPITEYYSDLTTAISYKYDGSTDTIIFSTNVDWPTATVICQNDNILTEIDTEDITIL